MKLLFFICLLFSQVLLEDGDYGDYELPEEAKKYIEADEACLDAAYTESACFSVKLNINNAQCCLLELTNSNGVSKNCSLLGSSLKDIGDIQVSNAFMKELAGFQIYGQGDDDVKHIQKYKCKDGDLTIKYGYDEYTDEEMKILKSENYCLKYFYDYLYDGIYQEKVISEETCFNADILESSKQAGLECGFFEYQFQFLDGSSKKISSCYVYDKNYKKLDETTTADFRLLASELSGIEGKMYKQFTISFKGKDGSQIAFDPNTGKVIGNGASFIKFTLMYLVLISLILF